MYKKWLSSNNKIKNLSCERIENFEKVLVKEEKDQFVEIKKVTREWYSRITQIIKIAIIQNKIRFFMDYISNLVIFVS